MKLKHYISLMLVFVLFSSQLEIKAGTPMTINFVTLGNCSQCKDRIEAALNTIDGVSYAYWDYSKDETTVTYDMSLTDPNAIMQTVADTGHDTEWYPAPLAAYNLLVGTCCEYIRTINYSQAQVGYLSLMGIWANQLSIGELDNKESISVYPTISKDYIQVRTDLPITDMNIYIYSISGSKILSQQMSTKTEAVIDINSLSKGSYIVLITDNTRIISTSKIIKK